MTINYLLKVRATGMTRLMSLHCRLCFHAGLPTKPFMGVEPKGRNLGGRYPDFEKEIWRALKRHLKTTHSMP